MLSRIADSLFWLNRYVERADGMLRVIYIHYILSLDRQENGEITWRPVLELFDAGEDASIAGLEKNTGATLKRLLVDNTNSNSLRSMINRARENARGVQDYITKEVWEEVNSMYHSMNGPTLLQELNRTEGIRIVEQFARHTVYFTGITDITMPRGTGWNFMNLGKYLERCLQTITITRKQIEQIRSGGAIPNDMLQWRPLLLSLSGYELYLKTYRTPDHSQNVFHQVALNEHFTRSIIYSLSRINFYLGHIVGKNGDDSAALFRSFGRLYSRVQYMDLGDHDLNSFGDFLFELRSNLLEFNTRFTQHFFSYS